jgi:excinuclease ABC subunit C
MVRVRADLRDKLDQLPDRPGVYLYRDRRGAVIYVGKAKSLRQRVRSYFQPSAQHPPRVANLVEEIADLELIVVDSEMEALILESNLIKRERPKFNVILRDDKHFPYLKLSVKDTYPRLSLVRRARLDGQRYVGPFLPAARARQTMKLVQRYFGVATCREIFDGKRRPCLYYHLDQCLAPCAGKTDPQSYARAVDDAAMFLDGRHQDLERSLKARMQQASEDQEYERAARYRDTLRTVKSLAVRQSMSSVGLEEQDYWAHHAEGDQVVLQLFQMRKGKIQARRELTSEGAEFEAATFYAAAMMQYYAQDRPPPEIYLPVLPDSHELLAGWLGQHGGRKVTLRVPRRGPKHKMLMLVERNAKLAFEARFRTAHRHGVAALEQLAEALGLDEPPLRIECFDISNIQGSETVASMVVFEGGKPRKSAYRSFNIRDVAGPDDYASIAEAVTRRYRRQLERDARLPDLVLIDGGAGQRAAAVGALARVGVPMLPVAALAKREEEIHLEGRGEPLRLERNSPALHLIQSLRDEAHRFALMRHRRRRRKRTLRTELTEIPGIGPVTAKKLLRALGSVRGVRKATRQELEELVGPSAARRIAEFYRSR